MHLGRSGVAETSRRQGDDSRIRRQFTHHSSDLGRGPTRNPLRVAHGRLCAVHEKPRLEDLLAVVSPQLGCFGERGEVCPFPEHDILQEVVHHLQLRLDDQLRLMHEAEAIYMQSCIVVGNFHRPQLLQFRLV